MDGNIIYKTTYSLLAEINLLFKYIQRKEIFFIKYQIKEMGQKIILK